MSDHPQRYLVTVCQHRSCVRNGSAEVLAAFQQHQSATMMASASECQGQCGSGPTVRVMPTNVWYCQVKSTDVPTIVEQHLTAEGEPVTVLLNPRMHQTQATYANLAAQYQAFLQEEESCGGESGE
ncbi:MAG: (2Fe-2S) ferredoxin domain-containing protein [Cyanobacteria bacterium P01_A01_bin.70]